MDNRTPQKWLGSLGRYISRVWPWHIGQSSPKKALIMAAAAIAVILSLKIIGLSFQAIGAGLVTFLMIYSACWVLALLRYKFYRDKARREFLILAPLLAGDQRKEFVPKLVELTQRKLPFKPNFLAPRPIMRTAFFPSEQNIHTEYNQEIMWETARLLRKGPEWRVAALNGVVLRDVCLTNLDLSQAFLAGADLTGSDLSGSCLREADLFQANLKGAVLKGTDCSVLRHGWNTLVDDNCRDKTLLIHYAKVLGQSQTLFQAALPKPIEALLRYKRPELFADPGGFSIAGGRK